MIGRGVKQLEQLLGQQALLYIIVHLMFIAVTWWALQAVKLSVMLKIHDVFRVRVLFVLITIAIGSSVANFFIEYFLFSLQLQNLF
jgi:uncharacterized integral membrane protein (TIGR02327 family)